MSMLHGSINNGVFDTALEAEYTPVFAKALATAILESIAGEYKLPNVTQHAKKLKMSHFHYCCGETTHEGYADAYCS